MDAISHIYSYCVSIGCSCTRNAPMAEYTSFKIGGPADILIVPDTKAELKAVLRYCKESGTDAVVIGKGSNILVPDEGLRAAVIVTSRLDKINFEGNGLLHCEAGVSLFSLCRYALSKDLSGVEFAYGIPGTVGGAAYMNAGAYGGEMKDVIVSCGHLDFDHNEGEFDSAGLDFGYRHSVYSVSAFIITDVRIQLTPSDNETIRAKMDSFLLLRTSKQPLELPSAGSTFKRPSGCFAGKLIEDCGLKGMQIGRARVSEKHAGFIVNMGGATAKDVRDLIAYVTQTVHRRTGVRLETEIKVL